MAVVLGTTLMAKERPISMSVSTGNEAATGVEDYLDYLLNDPNTQVVGMIVEQFRQRARFLAIAAHATGDAIVLLHPGKCAPARESAATHTGAMAGARAVMRVMVEEAEVVVVDSLEERDDVLDLAVRSASRPAR
jgi:acyl-CoA synthetase (NDP forming)